VQLELIMVKIGVDMVMDSADPGETKRSEFLACSKPLLSIEALH
jgi:hypothetical protein